MPFTADEFARRVRGIVDASTSTLPSYIGVGKPGFLTPPVTATPQKVEQLKRLEAEIDRVLQAQGTPLDPQFMGLGKIKNKKVRQKLQERFTKIIGMEESLATQGTGSLLGDPRRPYYFDILDPSQPLDEIGVMYQQVTKQYTGGPQVGNVAHTELVVPSGRIPRVAVAQRFMAQVNSEVPLPERWVTLDIETMGLDPSRGGMWQVVARPSDAPMQNMYFDFDAPGTTKAGPFKESILQGAKTQPIGDLKQILRTLDEYPAIVGHNLAYDIGWMIEDPTLKGDSEMVELLERLRTKASTGAIWDTNMLARHHLSDMKLADELDVLSKARLGRATQFSMENIMLETNLLELIHTKHGVSPEDIMRQLDPSGVRRGAHYGDVDTFFEDFLYREFMALQQGSDGLRLAYKAGGFKIPGLSDEANLGIRSAILERRAITPYLAMGIDQVDEAVLEALRASPNAADYIKEVDLGDLGTFPGVTITPVEHQIIQSHLQDFGGTLADDLDYDQMLKGIRAHDAIVASVPSLDAYAPFQRQLADAGIPFATLSQQERVLSSALTQSVTPKASELDKLLPRGRWHGATSAKTFVSSRRVALPMEVLRKAEEAGVFAAGRERFPGEGFTSRTSLREGDQLFQLSGFRYPYAGQKSLMKDVSANLMFSLDEEQAATEIMRLREFLEVNQRELGISGDVLQQILSEDFDAGLRRYGIQVGTILERRGSSVVGGQQAAEALFDALEEAQQGILVDNTDANTISYGVNVLTGPDETGNWTSGPTVAVKGSEAAQTAQYRAALEAERTLVDTVRADDTVLKILSKSKEPGTEKLPFKVKSAMDRMSDFYQGNTRTVRGAVAASAAVAGYYLYKRRESKNAIYEDAFAHQPTEPADFYDKYRAEMHVGMADQYNRGGVNPMATAGLVQNLDENKTRHTMMGPNKNAHLFGGSY